jgi:hypothetical protein
MTSIPEKHDSTGGFHDLIRRADPLSTVPERCEAILGRLERLIACTRDAAPRRLSDYRLRRSSPGPAPYHEESQWERSMWTKWGPDGCGAFLPNCVRLQTYQFPLKRHREDRLWGKVDLLGVSPERLPVVVELKRRRTTDTILRMLLEMTAYGIALQELWSAPQSDNTFKRDWELVSKELVDCAAPLPDRLDRLPLVGIAPQAYWDRALGRVPTDRTGRVPSKAWPLLRSLVEELNVQCGFAISFAVVYGAERLIETGDAGLEQRVTINALGAHPFVIDWDACSVPR